MIRLIEPFNIREYEDISAQIKDTRLEGPIRKAQELDLKPFLGSSFFYDFTKTLEVYKANKMQSELGDPPTQYYPTEKELLALDLLNGKEYEDRNGHLIVYDGLKKSLVYFAFARFVNTDYIRQTQAGAAKKDLDNSDLLSEGAIAKRVAGLRSEANAYLSDVEKYLQDHKANYPLWRMNERNKQMRQPGARIRAIDKTNYNRLDATGEVWNLNSFL